MLGEAMLGAAPLGQAALDQTATVRVFVRLNEADGPALAGAVVTARRRAAGAPLVAPAATQATTDAAGLATLALVPSGTEPYRVTATLAGALVLDVLALVPGHDAALDAVAEPNTGMYPWH